MYCGVIIESPLFNNQTFLLVSKTVLQLMSDCQNITQAGCLVVPCCVRTVLFKGGMVHIKMEMLLCSVSNHDFCF